MTEAQLQCAVIEMATLLGWKHYHPYDSRRSVSGWPDLVLVRGERTLFVELKSARGVLRPAQREWLTVLEAAGNEVFVWRPSHLNTGAVLEVLRRGNSHGTTREEVRRSAEG